jgi:hypothetical protein
MTVKTVHRGLLLTAVAGGLMLVSQPLASAAIQPTATPTSASIVKTAPPPSPLPSPAAPSIPWWASETALSPAPPPSPASPRSRNLTTRPARPHHACVITTRPPVLALPAPREQRQRETPHERGSGPEDGVPVDREAKAQAGCNKGERGPHHDLEAVARRRQGEGRGMATEATTPTGVEPTNHRDPCRRELSDTSGPSLLRTRPPSGHRMQWLRSCAEARTPRCGPCRCGPSWPASSACTRKPPQTRRWSMPRLRPIRDGARGSSPGRRPARRHSTSPRAPTRQHDHHRHRRRPRFPVGRYRSDTHSVTRPIPTPATIADDERSHSQRITGNRRYPRTITTAVPETPWFWSVECPQPRAEVESSRESRPSSRRRRFSQR